MSVVLEQGVIRLTGRCPAGDAQDLLAALQDAPEATVDIAGVERLHMAVMQVLIALRPRIAGKAATGPLSRAIFLRLISEDDNTGKNS